MEYYRLRLSLAVFGLALVFVWVAPNFFSSEKVSWWPSKSKLNYGLDIQGGLHLVMGVDVDGVIRETTNRMVSSLKAEFAKENLAFEDVSSPRPEAGEVLVVLKSKDDQESLRKLIEKNHGSSTLQVIDSNDNKVTLRYYESYLMDYKSKVISQAIETLRNRIDEFGVAEPSITQQGADRILVQLPGMSDAEKAKELVNTTAKLDFMLVSRDLDAGKLSALIAEAEKAGSYSLSTMKYSEYVARLNKDLSGKIPPKTVVYFEKEKNATKMDVGARPVLLEEDTNLGGGDLDGALVSFNQYGTPVVNLSFNPVGANKFAELTGANVKRQMAIVLDRVVKSDPVINQRIGGGRAEISLDGDSRGREAVMAEAQMIATALRAGALPASLEQLEERRVGPSLGSDSIEKAKMGSYVGALIIMIFMLIYYKGMGVIAVVSMVLNVISGLALLTTLGATLTLPGIAGIALTVGFAVDANVLIQERIKEELKVGSTWRTAIQEGYRRAMSAIIDSNVTTASTAVVLLYFGTGPVRGFAVTLLIGICTTLFANVFVSKVIVDTLIHKFGLKKLSI